ncbi:MAG TPA: NUMOD3 domain-containing DNA-binding protein [Candidatus Paceibacterota bacterium]|nr:NUMOD3 domain-containing DNA-binding protein [Candidatus Paceibacterota bacterium]
MKKFHYVYLTTNLVNGKKYIGDHSTDDLDDGYIGSGRPYFKNAIKKYGKQNFKREILEFCLSKEEAFAKQEKYIKEYNTLLPNGYNISKKGGNNCSGGISIDGINRIRNSKIGKKFSDDHRKKLSESHLGQIPWISGKNHSEETKNLISLKNTGKKRTPEMIENQRNSHIGIIHTDETKEKLRKMKLGKKFSDDHRKKLSESHLGQIPWNKGLKKIKDISQQR